MDSSKINEGEYQHKKLLKFLVVTIFTGSVFITSGKFVNSANSPKYYFVVMFLLFAITTVAVSHKRINLGAFIGRATAWCIYIVCSGQACYGLCQFLGWLTSNHSKFSITGSFDNPAGFAAVLAIGFPIGLNLFLKAKKIERYFVVIGLLVIALAIFLSGSRTGILAISISSLAFFLIQTNIFDRFKELRHYKLLAILGLIFILAVSFTLYHQKKDSANGRLLIWKVSSQMIKDKPVFGHGYSAFQAKYMDYQAEYFKDNPNSKYAQLADNVKHPFNEFIKVTVEFGLAGLIFIFSFILFVLWKVIKSENENRGLVFSGLVSFLVFACFSYPLQYIAVWLMLAFYLLALLPSKEIKIKHTPISITSRIVVVIVCTFFLFHFTKQLQAEIKWKTIAVNSLRGNTEEMLPEYEKLYSTPLKQKPFFLYNYGAELNVASQFDWSIEVLNECKKRFNDYDLQMLLADNYYKNDEPEKAIQIYEHALNMVPCRFLPLYNLFEIYKEVNQKGMAEKFAVEITNKKVKIPSSSVSFIKPEWEDKGVGNDGKGKQKGRGKKGRKGSGNKPKNRTATREETAKVENCVFCGKDLSEQASVKSTNTRIIEDIPEIPIKLEIIEVVHEKKYCSECQKITTAKTDLALSKSDFGLNTTVAIVYLWIASGLSFPRISSVLNTFFGQQISTSGLSKHVIRISKIMTDVYAEILEDIRKSGILQADETGWRINGDNWWLWVFGTKDSAYYTIDKLVNIQFHFTIPPRAVIFPRKLYFPVFHFFYTLVGNGNAEHIP